jgi:hypothetical protein
MGRVKNLDEIKTMIRERVGKRNTFRHAKREDVESVLSNLTSKDPELWAKEWSRVAKPYEEAGVKLEQAGKFKEAREAYVQAYAYYATGRYPTPHTPGKMACYRKSLEVYEKAGKYFEPPLERLDIPFGDKKIPIYLRLPRDGQKHAIVINFGGIDCSRRRVTNTMRVCRKQAWPVAPWTCRASASVPSKPRRRRSSLPP